MNGNFRKKKKLKAFRAAAVGTPLFALLLGHGSACVRADSIDIFSNTVTQSGGTFVYTYTFTIAEGEYTGATSYASVLDFGGLVGPPMWTPAASTGTVSTPLIAGLGNYNGFDDPTTTDLEVKFTTNVSDPVSPTAVPITLGTLTAVSFYIGGGGVYTSYDNVIAGGADPNHGGALVPVFETPLPPTPTPIPASIAGGMALVGALAVRKAATCLFALKSRRLAATN